MFYLRGLFSSAKNFCFVLVLLSAIFILVTSKKCSEIELQNLESEACRSFRGNFDSVPDSFDGHISSESVSRHSIEQRGFENACPSSSSFCFPSTLTGFLINEDNKLEPSDATGFQSEGFSDGLEQTRSNLSWSSQHDGIFRLLDGRLISCSMYQHDVFPEFSSHEGYAENGQQTYVPLDKKSKSSKSGENMYYPSLAFLTVKNVDADNYLSIYDPYSSNSQFYTCNFSEILLAPDEIASICLVFFPTHLGLSSAQLVLQTSFGGFLIQAKGFAIESPYLINHLSGFHISSSGRWRKNLSLFNPFDEALYVEEVTAWISTFSENTLRSSKSICSIHIMEDYSDYSICSRKGWLDIERSELGQAQIALRPYKNWEVGTRKTETIMELDISDNFEGKINAAFCLNLLNPTKNIIDIVMVPLETELSPIIASPEVNKNCKLLVLINDTTSIMMGNKSNGPTRYGFSIAKDAVTEAFVRPYGTATFGPIIFQPSNQLNLSSPNSPPCSKPLTKDVYAKNNGDFPLEVKKIKVSGGKCGLDGFTVHSCNSFFLQPGQSVRLHLSYQADFSVATIQRDFEVVLASGILVIPMKASLPVYMLSLCKRSMFWMRVIKKAAFVIVFAATLLYFRVPFLLPSFASRDLIKREKNPFSYVTRALDYWNMHFNWKNVFVRSVASGCSDGLAPEQGHVKPSSVENFDMQDNSGSRNLSVKVGKEKRKRRRKKKNTGAGILNQSDQSKCFEPSSKVNLLNNKVPSAGGWGPPWTCRSPFLVSTSTMAPHARAPGMKIHNPKNVGPEKELGVEEKYTYDIWGDHLFEFPLISSKEVANIISSFPIENNSESFFVRGPQTLMSNSVLPPVSSDLEGNE